MERIYVNSVFVRLLISANQVEDCASCRLGSSTATMSKELFEVSCGSPEISFIGPSVSDVGDMGIEECERRVLAQCTTQSDSGCSSKKRRNVRIQEPETADRNVDATGGRGVFERRVKSDTGDDRCFDAKNRPCENKQQESGGCSLPESGVCEPSAREHYYHNKLLATMQILANKEETVRVQNSSLAMAEARIAALTQRCAALSRQRDDTAAELSAIKQTMACEGVKKVDVSLSTHLQEVQEASVVQTLENNLSVIQDLYRECFYEAAKQEHLIEMLRSSCIEMRMTDRQKDDHIGRLRSVIDSQTWSLDKCQDIAIEVEGLKSEISNFLNSSNNDSGMWEECPPVGVGEDLQDITVQLLRLREMLTGDCTCGLEEENMRLKQSNGSLETQIGELRQTICDLEMLDNSPADLQYKEQIESREKQLLSIRQQLISLEQGTRDQDCACDTLTEQLKQTEAQLNEKITELFRVQQQCESRETTIRQLQEELNKSELIIKEKSAALEEAGAARAQLVGAEQRAAALRARLRRVCSHATQLHACYKEKVESAAALEAELQEAQGRGAALCGEARRALTHVRRWARRVHERHRVQEQLLREKEKQLSVLQERLEQQPSSSSGSEGRGRCACARTVRDCTAPAPSCSSVPIPPRRLMTCNNPVCQRREVSVQRPVRCDACTAPPCARCLSDAQPGRSPPLPPTPRRSLSGRVHQLGVALSAAQARWPR